MESHIKVPRTSWVLSPLLEPEVLAWSQCSAALHRCTVAILVPIARSSWEPVALPLISGYRYLTQPVSLGVTHCPSLAWHCLNCLPPKSRLGGTQVWVPGNEEGGKGGWDKKRRTPPHVEKLSRHLSILRPEGTGIEVWGNVKKSRLTMLFNTKKYSGLKKNDDDNDDYNIN